MNYITFKQGSLSIHRKFTDHGIVKSFCKDQTFLKKNPWFNSIVQTADRDVVNIQNKTYMLDRRVWVVKYNFHAEQLVCRNQREEHL
jgi:hypothetical protein